MTARIPTRIALRPLHPAPKTIRRTFATSAARDFPNIYVSDSNDPHFNLAFEDWLFRKTDPSERILYLYRNVPSVIIGRNQNPWKEINLSRLNELGIPFVRRKSGGGTVYHDLGNTNYCVFVPRLEFNRNTNAELVASALKRLDIPAYVNERNDICVEKFKMSRSLPTSFKLVNHRAYHHGTMLIDAQLANLRGVLGTKKEGMITKGVASVPSPVRNLREWNDKIDHESFVENVSKEFAERYNVSGEIKRIGEEEIEGNEYVRKTIEELKSWEWQYGNSPEFTHEITGNEMTISLRSRHGLITNATVATPPDDADLWSAASELCEILEGDRYGSIEKTREYLAGTKEGRYKELLDSVVNWLRKEM
ncbi:putative lipoate--protein ligase [Sporobolomyces salmoneus]|uniref:putative lipoate--protein ligase n=1 Tax=Sporobolomyces salmoneus TaxID=183962 RepID=UPI003175DF45